MRFLPLLLLAPLAGCGPTPSATVSGRGSSVVEPVMAVWADAYTDDATAGRVRVDYQPTGSGAGVQQFLAGTCDFACTDAPLTAAQWVEAGPGVKQVPLVIGAVVPVVNLPGVEGPIRFTGDVLAAIYLGKLTRWDDPALATANPGVAFPSLGILPVFRADASGSSLLFTTFLSESSAEFRTAVGPTANPAFPANVGVGRPKTGGVAAQVAATPGAIGYVELGYAAGAKLNVAAVRNRFGVDVLPNASGLAAAAACPTEPSAYPICGTTHAVVRPHRNAAARDFVIWCLSPEAQARAADHGFAPLPPARAAAAAADLSKAGP